MKKFILILLVSFTSFSGYCQLPTLEGFEGATFPPTGWLVKDNRTDGNPNWKFNTAIYPANTGSNAAFIDRENTGLGVYAEEWLITPQQAIAANSQFRFFTRQTLNGDTGTKYQIRVSTSANQADLGAYTVLVEYTETQLSTLTADQLDWEEKIIDLAFTGQRYFAFVKVFTQPGASTSGDRWLVDDVRIVPKCLDPVAPLGITGLSATGVTLTWTSTTNTQFQVEYGPSGFVLGTGTQSPSFTSNTSPRNYVIPSGTLTSNTAYQFYVRSVCAETNSDWVGPFNFNTPPFGSTCAAPIVVPSLPYSNSSNTLIYGNNITAGSPGATGCGTTGAYLGGKDVVYSYTATATGFLNITMNPQGAINTGLFVYNSCATIGTSCIGGVANGGSGIRTIPSLSVTAGQTIYVVLSSLAATDSYPYTLIIQQATCPMPTTLSASSFGTTSGSISWVNGTGSTATSWEYAVQPAGSDIPAGAGVQTSVNTNAPITGLTASTAYQYWVRADCGGGLFSAWAGPFLFNTLACEVANQCSYTFTLTDTGANGWEGGRMQVKQNGFVVATLGSTVTLGGPTVVTVPLCTGVPFDLFWSDAGTTPSEIRVSIKNSFAQTVYAMTTVSDALVGTTLYTGTVDCVNPMCLPPTNVTVTAITQHGATINWTSSGVPSVGWGIYVVPAGSPAPTATSVPTFTTNSAPPYIIPNSAPPAGLTQETAYSVYVQSICSVNGPSTWTGPKNFTTLPTCIKPTALTTATITPFGATFGWTNATGTAWQVLVLPAGSPAPTATSTGWVDVTTNPYVYTGLTPETAYVFYVRTNCGVNDLSGWAGPKAFTTTVACPKPTALTVANITPFTANLGWTNPTGAAWQVLVLPAGSPAPTAATTGWVAATTNPFIYPGLTPETAYVFYVRTDCGGINGVSTWAGPKAFTTLPTCYKPTGFTSSNLTAFSVQLSWTSPGTATSWQVLALPAGSPAPTAASTGWIAASTNPFIYTGLTPETAYIFYVRGDCGAIDGVSSWTGPRAVTTPPSCYKPTNLTATNITAFTAQLGWTNPTGGGGAWQVLALPAGSPAPTATTTGWVSATANPFVLTGLTQDTCYDYYVRGDCGAVNGLSKWGGPFNFCTTPTCPKPINLNSVSSNANSANLIWTEVGPATNWSIVIQAPGGPVPGPGAGCIVNTLPTTTAPYNTAQCLPNLAAGFYEFYVRSNCNPSDLSAWAGPFNFFIAATQPVCASVNVNVPTSTIDLCPGTSCVDLSASFTDSGDTTSYSVLPVAFAPPFPFTGGTQLNIATDDIWGPAFPLPFNFCFYGVNYPTVNVGSNGVLTFTPHASGDTCPWMYNQTLPDPTFPITNAIYGVYQDLNPSVDTAPAVHSINYQVLGVAPCRAFVVNFYNVAQFSCGTSVGLQTSQVVLYETSNIIEVYVQDRTSCTTWNDGSGVIGVQNAAGTLAQFPPGRNTGTWDAHNEAWRFTPSGPSNVQFSWLKDGVFYSNNPTINVCVSATTTMTAQALYTGCGGQQVTKTDNVLLNVHSIVIPPMQNVNACQTYTLPALTVGHYFSQTGGVGPIDPSIPITELGSHTIYVYATTTSTPSCSSEISFTVTIGNLVAPTVVPVEKCQSYTLPPLDLPFNYYTQPNGAGTMHPGTGGDIITTSQTLYIYGVSGVCSDQSSFTITIDNVQAFNQTNVTDCNNFTLPVLPANNNYYTQTGGPTGTGTLISAGTVINASQTIYIYAASGVCTDEKSFTVTINGIQTPIQLTVTQPTCLVSTGTIHVDAPGSPTAPLPPNLFISEVTDAEVGSLTYVELYNGTGAPVDLSNYKLKVYNNGGSTASCDLPLSGIIANNSTNVIKISGSPDQGGVHPDQTFPLCGGVNTNDNIRLTTSSDVEVDLWGRTDGVDFTPSNLPGYVYRRLNTAVVPSLTWNAADWDAIDPEDYTNVGSYTPAVVLSNYQYNIDGGTWQSSALFTNVAVGPHVISVKDVNTGCTESANVDIHIAFTTTPETGFTYSTPVCISGSNPAPLPVTGFAAGGHYTYTNIPLTAVPSGLALNSNTGVVDLANSIAGDYSVTYAIDQDLTNCIAGASTSFPITINPVVTSNFPPINAFCAGSSNPVLVTTSPNGVTGTWLPAVVDNTASGNYVFTPTAGLCALGQTLNVNVFTVATPNFAAIPAICSGTAVPTLATTSPNGITGIWTPAAISNTASGPYVFTPDPGQCGVTQTLTVTITNPNQSPGFAEIAPLCVGSVAPVLQTTSPIGIVGSWNPATIDTTENGSYIFTPDVGQCAVAQTVNVAITQHPTLVIDGGCQNGNYTLAISISPAPTDTVVTYIWKDSEGNVVGDNSATLVVTQTGNYTCQVTTAGCSSSQPFNVTTVSCTIQKGISPKGTNGGDGLNDYFDLAGQNVKKLEIFNRYGTKVYTKENYSKEWYGQSDAGNELPDGTYFYSIEFEKQDSRTGWIYINREK